MIDRLYKSTPIIRTGLCCASTKKKNVTMKGGEKWQRRSDIKCEMSWVVWNGIEFAQCIILKTTTCGTRATHTRTLSRTGLAFDAWCEIADVRFLCVLYCTVCVVLSTIKILRSTLHSLTLCVKWSDESINSNAHKLINIFLQHLHTLFPFILSFVFILSI